MEKREKGTGKREKERLRARPEGSAGGGTWNRRDPNPRPRKKWFVEECRGVTESALVRRRKGTPTCAVLRVRGKAKGEASESGAEASAKQERVNGRSRAQQPHISGDNSLRDPPVPIPNTEVKPQHADSTWLETAREGRSSPDSKLSFDPVLPRW